MTVVAEKVLQDALGLPPVDRAELIERLFKSFDSSDEASVDSAWAVEVESRLDAYDHGGLGASPAADVLSRINRQ